MPEIVEKTTSVNITAEDKGLLEQIRDSFDPRPTLIEALRWIIRQEYARRFPADATSSVTVE